MQADSSIGDTLSVFPDLAREAGLQKVKQTFRVWNLLRHIRLSQDNVTGFIPWQDALGLLQRLGWSKSRSYALLNEGMDALWHRVERDQRRFPGQHGIRLAGVTALADTWGIRRLSRFQVEVPIELTLPPENRGKHTRVAIWNAIMFHVQLPGPKPIKIAKKNGEVVVKRPKPGHPISRQSLESKTGISRSSQIRYGSLKVNGAVVTKKRANYVPEQLAEIVSKNQTYRIVRRLGNTYTSILDRKGFGQAKIYNTANDGHLAHSAEGSSSPVRIRKRFFEFAKSYQQERHHLMDEPMIRSTFNARYQLWDHLENAPRVHRYDDVIPTVSDTGDNVFDSYGHPLTTACECCLPLRGRKKWELPPGTFEGFLRMARRTA